MFPTAWMKRLKANNSQRREIVRKIKTYLIQLKQRLKWFAKDLKLPVMTYVRGGVAADVGRTPLAPFT